MMNDTFGTVLIHLGLPSKAADGAQLREITARANTFNRILNDASSALCVQISGVATTLWPWTTVYEISPWAHWSSTLHKYYICIASDASTYLGTAPNWFSQNISGNESDWFSEELVLQYQSDLSKTFQAMNRIGFQKSVFSKRQPQWK